MAAKAPLLCFLLILVASAVLISPPGADAADCNQWSKIDKCEGALAGTAQTVSDGCCAELKAQYECLCDYATVPPSPDTSFLKNITQEAGMLVLISCDLEALSCTNSATAAA